jgi:deferrochelatase/peroxidase EfeB
VTDYELNSGVSSNEPSLERGLAFVSYQSRIDLGFQFIQTQWANAVNFAPGKIHNPGFDLVFGQNNGGTRWMNGYNIADTTQQLTLSQEFVVSRGGEYFFSPSIEAIRDVISV